MLPAAIASAAISRINIASTKAIDLGVIPAEKRGRVFGSYVEGLEQLTPCLAYISLPNALHCEWAYRALQAGFDTLVDKPGVVSAQEAQQLYAIARSQQLCLYEVNVWLHHPMAAAIDRIIKNDGFPNGAIAVFTSPPFDSKNFRYNPALGGGIIFDRGSYAITCGTLLFGGIPDRVSCRVTGINEPHAIDSSCSITLAYPKGELNCFFSLNGEYRNGLTVLGRTYSFDLDRIFTPPDNFKARLLVRRNNHHEEVVLETADAFRLFLEESIRRINQKDFTEMHEQFLENSIIMDRIVLSARSNGTWQ